MRGLIARVRQSLRLAGPERGGLAGGPDLQDSAGLYVFAGLEVLAAVLMLLFMPR